ncbi:HAD family hydrolase [Neobacillus sp. LXY-1]|uniref:HAD family hydrolase n=1 Tax=Neobacillus sp. LXY-1 TaxID=3379133 RepID=UPI003EDEB0EB
MKAVIFDFDGTIVDTESMWFEGFKELLDERFQIELPLDIFAKCVGTTDETLFQYIESQTGTAVNPQELSQTVRDRFSEKLTKLELREGVRELLEEIKQLGYVIGLASSSSKEWVERFLIQFELMDYFSVIKTKEDVLRVKPDPALYQKALEELQIEPAEAVAIEDSVNGSMAAIDAGMKCVVIPNQVTSFLNFHEKTIRFESFADFNFSKICG